MTFEKQRSSDVTVTQFVRSAFSLLSASDRRKFALLALGRSLTSGLDLLAIVLLGIGVERLSSTSGGNSTALLFLAGGIMLGRSVLTLAIARLTFSYFARVEILIGREFTTEVFSARQEILDSFRTQQLGFALSQGTNSLTTRALGFSMIVVADGIAAAALVAGFMFMYPIEGVLMVASICIIMLPVQRYINRRVQVAARLWSASVIELLNEVQEFQLSRREIFLNNASLKASMSLDDNRQIAARQASSFNFLLTVPRIVVEVAMLLMAGLLLIVAYSRMSSEAFLVFSATLMAVTFRVAPMAMGVVGAIGVVTQSLGETAVNREIRLLTNNVTSPGEAPRSSVDDSSAVSVSNLSYSFPDSDHKLFDGVSFDIDQNELCAIVGKSGGGKTTLLECIIGLRHPAQGDVSLFGSSPEIIRHTSPGMVGLVPQQPAVRSGTLAENVTLLSSEPIDRERVTGLLNDVGLGYLVDRSDSGIDLRVGEGNLQLSGGERQRLGLARALYNNPKLLVLDEPTSALDGLTEDHVFDLIEQQRSQRTVLVVTHRRPRNFVFDQVLVLEKGQISRES